MKEAAGASTEGAPEAFAAAARAAALASWRYRRLVGRALQARLPDQLRTKVVAMLGYGCAPAAFAAAA